MSALVCATALSTVVAFFICAIPFGLIIGKYLGKVDVRTVGSGNIGTTNVARSAGKLAAAATLACDLGKGLVCMLVARYAIAGMVLAGEVSSLGYSSAFAWVMSCVFMGCVLGHVFSPYLHFHGGKGIAVGFGAALGLCWPAALGLLVVFILIAVPTRYVSLGSCAAAASVPIFCVVFGFTLSAIVPVVISAAVVIWAHRANIAKLVRGEESKFSFHKSDGVEKDEGDKR